MKNNSRRVIANVSSLGIKQLHLRNPYIVAWWSAAFPGFGHLLLGKSLRGYVLVLWEILLNNQSHLNMAMVYSFTGHIEMAKEVLDPRWVVLYIPVYLFAIWDSYRASVEMNHLYILADKENADITAYRIGSLEINYLDKRKPFMAFLWSLLTPGLGQLYLHRVVTAFFLLLFLTVYIYYSKALLALHLLFLGDIEQASQVIDPQWFMYLPSQFGFAAYHAYVNAVENNKLFKKEQQTYLEKNYQQYQVKFTTSKK